MFNRITTGFVLCCLETKVFIGYSQEKDGAVSGYDIDEDGNRVQDSCNRLNWGALDACYNYNKSLTLIESQGTFLYHRHNSCTLDILVPHTINFCSDSDCILFLCCDSI